MKALLKPASGSAWTPEKGFALLKRGRAALERFRGRGSSIDDAPSSLYPESWGELMVEVDKPLEATMPASSWDNTVANTDFGNGFPQQLGATWSLLSNASCIWI